ncbi:putative mitochondrial carrier [Scheffersomyces xylosifermentans]|uniref:putative mitochondrial carrier n=1 Tax=Scheffersomyces xylosifermentans TaxID=1304137 RepID=UPI00315D84D9
MTQVFTSSTIPLSFGPTHEPGPWHKGSSPPQSSPEEFTIIEQASPILNCMLAGGFGGMVGDTSMHSLDTVKTRQQGLPHNLKYKNMIPAYRTILKEEGFFRGLYGGYTPAILGSFPSTAAFFGTYEYTKRKLINEYNLNETFSYFVAGVLGDLASSIFYVPSEVLKTRLQLQGKYNNPFTKECGYNYKGLGNAIVSIAKKEGPSTFVFGYKETLFRDLPFSALQFAFYERFRQLAILYNKSSDLPVSLELLTGAAAGGLAGTLTTPLDVIKTRIQTATNTAELSDFTSVKDVKNPFVRFMARSSTFNALISIYKHEGIFGAFSGVGPRFIWTGIQSSIMLLLYQVSLKKLDSMLGTDQDSGALKA